MATRRAASKTSAQAARTLMRVERAWQMRLQGATQRQIAKALGVSQPAIVKLLRRGQQAATARIDADVVAARAIEIERREHQLSQSWAEWEAQPAGQRRDALLREINRASDALARLRGLDSGIPPVVVQQPSEAARELRQLTTRQLEVLEAVLEGREPPPPSAAVAIDRIPRLGGVRVGFAHPAGVEAASESEAEGAPMPEPQSEPEPAARVTEAPAIRAIEAPAETAVRAIETRAEMRQEVLSRDAEKTVKLRLREALGISERT